MNRFPFDWKHPVLYLIAFTVVFSIVYYVAIIARANISYFASVCCILLAFINDLKEEVITLNAIGKDEESHIKLEEKLSDFIEFHVIVKELSNNHYIVINFYLVIKS